LLTIKEGMRRVKGYFSLLIVGTILLGLLSSSQCQYTNIGCLLNATNKCNGRGVCERTGLCTCNEGFTGDNCENQINSTFKKEGVGKGFIAGWTIFWIFLNFALPIVIYIMIKYLNEKNCDSLKEIFKDCTEAFCCCFKKSEDQNFARIGQDEANAAIVLRAPENPEQPKPAKDNEAAKPTGNAKTNTNSTPKANEGSNATAKESGRKKVDKEPSNLPEDLFLGLLKENPSDIKWTKKEAGPTKRAVKGLVKLLNSYDFNVQASFHAILDAQEKAIKERGFKQETKIRDELEKEVPLARSAASNFKEMYNKKIADLEKQLATSMPIMVSDSELLEFLNKAE